MATTSKPWREVLPITNEELPGVFLTGARYREALTQTALAQATGCPGRRASLRGFTPYNPKAGDRWGTKPPPPNKKVAPGRL